MKKYLTMMFTLMLSLFIALPVHAANYAPVAGTSTELTKYLVVNEDAEIPEAEFEFTVTAGSAQEATADTVKVWAGINPELVKVNNVAETGTVEFVAGEEATAAKAVEALGSEKAEGKKAATKTIALDFSGVSFTEPGVYRYLVTETDPVAPIKAVDSKVTTVDVYVEDVNGALVVKEYVAYEGTVSPAPKNAIDMSEWLAENEEPVQADYQLPNDGGDDVDSFEAAHAQWEADYAAEEARLLALVPNGAEAGEKDDKFVNEVSSANLEFGKEVTGNQGSKDQWFKFTLTLNNLGARTMITMDMAKAENGVAHENTATSYSKEVMEAANKRDDNAKWRFNGVEYDSKALAHAAAISTITAGTDENEGKFIFNGEVFETEELAEAAAEVACVAPLDGQQIIADENGSATVEVYLHDGMYVLLKGLPEEATYSLVEESAAGYEKIEKISQAVNGTKAYEDEVSGTIGAKLESCSIYADEHGDTISQDEYNLLSDEEKLGYTLVPEPCPPRKAKDQNVYTGYTNNREGVIPTGLIVSLTSGALLVGVAGAGIYFSRRKREDEE